MLSHVNSRSAVAQRKQMSSGVSCRMERKEPGTPSCASDSCCIMAECRVSFETGVCTTLNFCSGGILRVEFKTEGPYICLFSLEEASVKMRPRIVTSVLRRLYNDQLLVGSYCARGYQVRVASSKSGGGGSYQNMQLSL